MIQKLKPIGALPTSSQTKNRQQHTRIPESDLPKLSFTGRLIENVDELESLELPWSRLIEMSVRPNPFFDPDYLIPAFRHLNDGSASVVLIDAPRRCDPTGPRVLCGLFPVVKKRFYGFPISCLEIWKHDQCFDCTPLIRRDCAAEVLEFMFSFLAEQLKINLLSMNTVVGEGTFANLLTDNIYRNSRTVFHRDEFTRACFRPMQDSETFINTKVSKNTRKGTQRLSRKLASQGDLVTDVALERNNLWIEEFLQLESAGWKGRTGTSLASEQSTAGFFREMVRRMWDCEKLIISRTAFNGSPISMYCDLFQQGQGAHFKTAFDESFSEYSPGLIAELANIHRLHEAKIDFVDSCADPDHSMINRVWSDRVRFQSLVIAMRGRASRFAASLFPLMRFGRSLVKAPW